MAKKPDAHHKHRVDAPIPAVLIEAKKQVALGRVDLAQSVLRESLSQDPNQPQILVALGVLAAQSGQFADGIEWLQMALSLEAANVSTLCWLSFLHLQLGEIEKATSFAEQAIRLDATIAEPHACLARCYVHRTLFQEAVSHFQRAAEIDANNAALLVEFAEALIGCRRWLEARQILRRAVLIAPEAQSLQRLAYLEYRYGILEDAERFCRRALRKEPESSSAHVLMARILTEQFRFEEADALWSGVDDTALVKLEKAQSFAAVGRFEEALGELERSIEMEPDQGDAYRTLVFAKRIGAGDLGLVGQIERLLESSSTPDTDRVNLLYALGKSYDDLSRYESAIECFDRANALNRALQGNPGFDRAAFSAVIDARIETFTQRLFEGSSRFRSDTSLPIFVVGMMRSGTSLAEQILSCHPSVGGAGEQDYWGEREASLVDFGRRSVDFGRLRACSAEYCALISGETVGLQRVVDKNPANLQFAGLIHLAMPNSRIIHMRRHAVDTALSIWTTPINTTAEFFGDREDIVFAYKECLRLMDHWRKVLPPDRFMEVQYEELVSEPDAQVRRMVEFCGLEWDEAYLRPELNRRRVSTPSMWQVRQPIYRSSTCRWKLYEPWLGAFQELVNIY